MVAIHGLGPQVGAILISLEIRRLQGDDEVVVPLSLGQKPEKAPDRGAVVEKLRVVRRERDRPLVGSQGAPVIVPVAVQRAGGIGDAGIRCAASFGRLGRGKGIEWTAQRHQALGAAHQQRGIGRVHRQRLVHAVERGGPLLCLHQAQGFADVHTHGSPGTPKFGAAPGSNARRT